MADPCFLKEIMQRINAISLEYLILSTDIWRNSPSSRMSLVVWRSFLVFMMIRMQQLCCRVQSNSSWMSVWRSKTVKISIRAETLEANRWHLDNKELPIFVYDDLDANIFSRVESTFLHPGAKKFIVDERMEIKIPKNLHLYRNFGSKSMASGQQVSVGCTQQGQGLNKRRAAVGHDSLQPETPTSTMCVEREQHPIPPMNKVSVGCTEQGQGLNKRRAAVGHDSLQPETTTSTMRVEREQHPIPPMNKGKKRIL